MNNTPSSTANVPMPPDRDGKAHYLLSVEGINDHDTFFRRLNEEGENVQTLANFPARILLEKGYATANLSSLLDMYLLQAGAAAHMKHILTVSGTGPGLHQLQAISPAITSKIANLAALKNPALRAAHKQAWSRIDYALHLPDLPANDPLKPLIDEIKKHAAEAQKELEMRELLMTKEIDIQSDKIQLLFLIGNESLKNFYSYNTQDPALKEVLFAAFRDLIVNHGYSFTEIW